MKSYFVIFILLFGLLATGTIGYQLIEGWNFIDSLYMSVITLTTVGYSEVKPLSDLGKFFNMGLILWGVAIVAYASSRLVANITNIDFDKRRKLKMQKIIDSLNGHTIVCGYGRMGEVICNELHKSGFKFVVIEKDELLIKKLKDKNYFYIEGDAAHDDELVAAGIKRARGLVSAINSDSNGLFIALAGRSMNKELFITIRANDLKAKNRILRAGANKVVLPHIMSGQKVADSLINPAVEDFFDLTGASEKSDKLQLADLIVSKESKLHQRSIKEMGNSLKDLIIVGIRNSEKEFQFKPSSDYRFKAGDCIITMGTVKDYHDAKQNLI